MTRPVAIVTGAGSGIGAAVADRLAARYDLILTHLRNDDSLESVVSNAEAAGSSVTTIVGGLTSDETITELEAKATTAGSHLTALVSNAGAYPRIPWAELDLDEFRRQIEVNLVTHAACAKLVTPAMTVRGNGRIIAVSSVLTQIGRVELAGYIAAKSGLEGLIHALARELGPYGITANCVRAGSIEVAAEHEVVSDHDAMIVRQLARQCIKRRGSVHDIASAVEYLISDDAGFITGQSLTVDGGWYLT